MSPWFDVMSGLNFHPLALVSIIAVSSVCELCVGVCWRCWRCCGMRACNICVSVCDSGGGMRAAGRTG